MAAAACRAATAAAAPGCPLPPRGAVLARCCGLSLLAAATAASGSHTHARRTRGRRCVGPPHRRPLAAIPEADMAAAMEVLPNLDEPEPQEPEEPPIVLSVNGEVVVLRSGRGLSTVVKTGTVVEFAGGAAGVLLAWKESVGVVQLTSGQAVAGETATGTGKFMTTNASTSLRGRIVDPHGKPIDGRPAPPVPANPRLTFAEYKGMQERTNQYRPLFTGVLGIDFSVPVGRGQTMLFQGTDAAKDKEHLWPDLLAVEAGPNAKEGPAVCICVCASMEEAEALRGQLEARGCWERCTIVVSSSEGPGAGVVALNGAVAFAEQICDEDGEALVLFDLEPMHRVWNTLAGAAGEERRAKGILADPQDDAWIELEGTVLRESIAERRKFWFALISRAANSQGAGSVSLLAWAWEQAGGLDHRKQKALELKLEELLEIPRITEATRQKMIEKVKEKARAEGLCVDGDQAQAQEPEAGVAGVPNWEIEELKSITDGHILLLRPKTGDSWSWRVDPYKSLPRLGTDAMHPALISIDAHKLRLKMMQGRDRADMLHDTLGAKDTLDSKEQLEMRFVELILEQPSGAPQTVDQQVARLAIVANPNCRPLREPGACSCETLQRLADQLLESEAGQRVAAELGERGKITEECAALLADEMGGWGGNA